MKSTYRHGDHYSRQAKTLGFAARSVFKLMQIDQQYHLLKPGQHVLDLGAAPGSWSRYAADKVGPRGSVLAIDIQPIPQALPAWVVCRVEDVFACQLPETTHFDVVLSDMAPATTGIRQRDSAASLALVEAACHLAARHLKPQGHLVVKIFESEALPVLQRQLRPQFAQLWIQRPKATRSGSRECFLVGMQRIGHTPNTWFLL